LLTIMIVSNLQEFYSNLSKGAPIIAIDYGNKKTGVAISNQEQSFAMPFRQINIADVSKQIREIIVLMTTHKVCGAVIGLPIDTNGLDTEQTKIVRNFATVIASLVDVPIYLQDERFTSKAADNLLKSMGIKRKERNAQDDSVAASIILQDTINSMRKFSV
jgi:putative holliday junction resolvase